MALDDNKMDELFLRWANGSEEAARFLHSFSYIVRVADDIVDGDSQDPQGDMGRLLYQLMVTAGGDPFFRRNVASLIPVIANAFGMWVKSGEWQHDENRKTRMFGFVYREGVEHVAHAVALLTGGYDHMLKVMEEMHTESHRSSSETFEDWEKEV